MAEQLQEKDLKKLNRSELLEIMLAQSEEIDRLRAELAQKDAELQDRAIKIQRSGSIAEASLALTKVFEEAQKACDLYLANVAPGARTKGSSLDSGIGNRGPSSVSYPPTVDPDTTSVLAGQHAATRQASAPRPSERPVARGKHFSS